MRRILTSDRIVADPFGEHRPAAAEARFRLLGATFRFIADDHELLGLVTRTYGDLPQHRLTAGTATITLRLIRTADDPSVPWTTPPRPRTVTGGGLFCSTIDAANFAVLSPSVGTGMVAISPRLSQFPYNARYELLEFAVYTLASRMLRLVPLHAACVSLRRRALLLMGDSGAGKTTLAIQCLLGGFEFLSEDSTFVHPATRLVTGIANYIHLRPDSLRFLPARQASAWRRQSVFIRRRSGVEKLEVDLRRVACRLARSACRATTIVFLSPRSAGKGPLLRTVPVRDALARVERLQAYGAAQPNWPRFMNQAAKLQHWELRRGSIPGAAIGSLKALLKS